MAGGAPKNNDNWKGLHATRALEMVLDELAGETVTPISRQKTLMEMWRPVVLKAMSESDVTAVNAVADRLDGKPKQTNEHTGPGGSRLEVHLYGADAEL